MFKKKIHTRLKNTSKRINSGYFSGHALFDAESYWLFLFHQLVKEAFERLEHDAELLVVLVLHDLDFVAAGDEGDLVDKIRVGRWQTLYPLRLRRKQPG